MHSEPGLSWPWPFAWSFFCWQLPEKSPGAHPPGTTFKQGKKKQTGGSLFWKDISDHSGRKTTNELFFVFHNKKRIVFQ
jgi:hypothetical protein